MRFSDYSLTSQYVLTTSHAGDGVLRLKVITHMNKSKTVWARPAFTVTATGFEVTMYLGTQTA